MDTRAITLEPAGRFRASIFSDHVVRLDIDILGTGTVILPQGVYRIGIGYNSTGITDVWLGVGLRSGVHAYSSPIASQPIQNATILACRSTTFAGEVVVVAMGNSNTLSYRNMNASTASQITIMRLGDVCQNNAAAFSYTHDPIPPS